MVVERDHSQSVGGGLLQPSQSARQRFVLESAALLAPATNGVQADDDDTVSCVGRLRLSEDMLPIGECPGEPCGNGVRDVMVPRNRQEWQPDPPEELRSRFQLLSPATVRQVARDDEQGWLHVGDQLAERSERLPGFAVAHVQIGEVEDARGQGRGRLYARTSRIERNRPQTSLACA